MKQSLLINLVAVLWSSSLKCSMKTNLFKPLRFKMNPLLPSGLGTRKILVSSFSDSHSRMTLGDGAGSFSVEPFKD